VGAALTTVNPGDWVQVRKNFQRIKSVLFGPDSTPTFGSISLTGLTEDSLIYAGSGGTLTSLGVASDGQLVIGSTGTTPVLAALTGTANRISVTNGAGSITLTTPQDIHTGATSFTVAGETINGKLFVNQDADAIGIEIDSEATSVDKPGLKVVTGAGATCAEILYGDGNAGSCYLGLPSNNSYVGTFAFMRNLTAESTDCSVVYMKQDHDDDDRPTLELVNDGSGPALLVTSGAISVLAGVTISTGLTVPDDGYIGSESEPQAIQIEADGDVVFHQAIDVPSDIVCGGHVLFDLDNGHIGYFDNSPILTFNNADDRVELTGTAFTIPDGAYIGSASDPDAIQIEVDGDIVMSQDLGVTGSITAAGLDLTGITDGNIPYMSAAGFADSPMRTDGSQLELFDSTPYLTLHNLTHEDSDGGRESRIIARGEQSGEEESTLGWLEFSHDGAADDQNGQLRVYINDGDDETSPTLRTKWGYDGSLYHGDGGVTNYSKFEADGTLEFNGTATVWNDANMGVAQLALPASGQPDEDEFVDEDGSDTGISTWAFAIGEKVSGSIEIPHDYKEGSDITFHVHWQGIAAPSGTDYVKWQCTYTVAQGNETLDAVSTTVGETAIDTQYDFKRTDCTVITGTNFNIGDQFLFTLERIAAAGDAYAGDALVATVGFHYECDTVGSRQITIK